MADYADIHSTYESNLFQIACQDVLRIVSILSLDSTDVIQVKNRTYSKNIYEKFVFFSRFLYLVFIKGFTPTIFDVLPYWLWKSLSIAIYIYRLVVLPFILRLTGYGKYTSWEGLGTKQPSKEAKESKPLRVVSLSKETNLSKVDFGDEKYELFISKLFQFTTYLSPHSHSPLNPFIHNSYPGNFFDHLTGVYKILLAWGQPQYVVRAGLFHSVYGTFDYRYSLYDLRDGRQPLQKLIGEAAEEISFTICTSDRIGLMRDLIVKMYGENAKLAIDGSSITMTPITSDLSKSTTTTTTQQGQERSKGQGQGEIIDGNPYPKLVGVLGADGFAVRNHITQKVHLLPPDLFAQFSMVMIADFMEQGVIALGAADNDICMFRFMRYRFWGDFILYLSPYLRVKPIVWDKYMGMQTTFIEPTRDEIIRLKHLWLDLMQQFHETKDSILLQSTKQLFYYKCNNIVDTSGRGDNKDNSEEMKQYVLALTKKYPYLAEPFIILSASMQVNEKIGDYTRKSLAKEGLLRLEEWGMLTIKCGSHGLKEAMQLVNTLS